jgi:hypothetical protein
MSLLAIYPGPTIGPNGGEARHPRGSNSKIFMDKNITVHFLLLLSFAPTTELLHTMIKMVGARLTWI